MEQSGRVPDRAFDPSVAPENRRRMNRVILSLWAILTFVVIASFAALLYFGGEVYQMAPPIPEEVVSFRWRGHLHRRRPAPGPGRMALHRRA